jgi:hypothetical protein
LTDAEQDSRPVAKVHTCDWPDAQKKTIHAVEQDRDDVAQARRQWIAEQPGLDPDKLVFIRPVAKVHTCDSPDAQLSA